MKAPVEQKQSRNRKTSAETALADTKSTKGESVQFEFQGTHTSGGEGEGEGAAKEGQCGFESACVCSDWRLRGGQWKERASLALPECRTTGRAPRSLSSSSQRSRSRSASMQLQMQSIFPRCSSEVIVPPPPPPHLSDAHGVQHDMPRSPHGDMICLCLTNPAKTKKPCPKQRLRRRIQRIS